MDSGADLASKSAYEAEGAIQVHMQKNITYWAAGMALGIAELARPAGLEIATPSTQAAAASEELYRFDTPATVVAWPA